MEEKTDVKEPADVEAKAHTSSDTAPEYDQDEGVIYKSQPLARNLQGRHMQMIAIGGAIGAGLFVGTGSSLATGGPASLVICYLIVGVMLLCTVQALAEMAVLYPVNGAFFTYVVRFVDPSWGFAVGWDYAITWLTVLPFELTAAALTIRFWRDDINVGVWITVFLVVLSAIQVFGVRGYGEVEFILSAIKIAACIGFIILGIIIDCGGTGPQGYIGAKYWYNPGAFANGFQGFCSVFVVAAFAFAGTELVGLAAAESATPHKTIPSASRQVFWRIAIFYVLNLLMVGLLVPYTDDRLLKAASSNTKDSPFVIAILDAGIPALPSIFNVVITLSVISVANSCTFGSTRTIQALAERGMAPRFFSKVDNKGRPLAAVILQILFGLLAFIGESAQEGTVFTWLLSLSGLSYFFVWGSICLSHIRFRMAWKAAGHTVHEMPYSTPFGIIGSYIGLGMNILCLIASFYVAVWPPGSSPDVQYFFQQYLAAPLILALYIFWKLWSRKWRMWIPVSEMDIRSGLRVELLDGNKEPDSPWTWKNWPLKVVRLVI
ncbi:amino acid permease [Talaromyces proteolyticus]|uniref:Amino acid permease n=1 Tax=Talaromyces proteolyticus TaxID=1131652 RepID=A0AAD4KGP6_9EURO|nr:amino acid permease [Talaromyces proteolyticus]KAH8689127.1 amino acid permease [Talaromyces proteolyticus]